MLCAGAPCEKEFNIIKNYDGFAELIRMHGLFSEFMEVPQENIFLSVSVKSSQSITQLREAGDAVHVDFQGKHYKTQLTKMNQAFHQFDLDLYDISTELKSDSKIDLVVFLKDHGMEGKFGEDDREFIDIVFSIENNIPSSKRQRTLLFIDSCDSGSFSILHEYIDSFDKLCSYDEELVNRVFIFLTKYVVGIQNGPQQSGKKVSKEKIYQVVTKQRAVYQSRIKDEVLRNKFSSITDDQFASFLYDYQSLCLDNYKIHILKNFFSSPLWVFCSSSKDSKTFSYLFRKFPRTIVPQTDEKSSSESEPELKDDKSSSELEDKDEEENENENIDKNMKEELKKEEDDEDNDENQKHKEEIIKQFDATPMDINLNDDSIVYIQTGSFFMNAITVALFQHETMDDQEEKGEKEIVAHGIDTLYERFKKTISLEMKRQESIFKEPFFIHHYESDISNVSSVLSKMKDYREKQYKNTSCAKIRKQIYEKMKEKGDIYKQISTLKKENNGDEEQLNSVQEKIQSLKNKLKDIQKYIDKLNTEKNELIALNSVIIDYTNLESELAYSIKDIHLFFENFILHPEKVFFSYNTESIAFPNFASLLTDGKSFSSLIAEEDIGIHDYTYINHRYASLLKKQPTKHVPLNFCYLPSPATFSHKFFNILNEDLLKHGYDLMVFKHCPDEYEKSARFFFNRFITNVEEQFSPRHGCRLGPLSGIIKLYYQTHQEISFEKLMRLMLKCVRKADEYWKKEYEKEEKPKKILKQKKRNK